MLLLVVSVVSANALAGGFQLFEQSTKGLGSAFSDQAAANDTSTAFWNPAGLTRLHGQNLSLSAHLIKPSSRFVNEGSHTSLPPPSGLPLTGGNGGDPGDLAVIPAFYFSHEVNDRWALGVAVNSPFGLGTKYDDGWVGRYHALNTELQTINLNPSLGFRINEQLSLGGGLDGQYAKAKLSNALDFSTVCLAQGSATPTLAPLCVAGGFTTPGSTATDGKVSVEGDSWALGWNAAFLFDLSTRTRLGASYRSKMRHNVKGDASFKKPANLPGPISQLSVFTNGDVKTTIELPETITLALHTDLTDSISLTTASTWTRWSRLRELRIHFDNGAPDSATQLDWRDAWRIAIGSTFHINQSWAFRTGIAYDQTPVKKELGSERIPDANRVMLGLGASYRLSPDSSLDLAYVHWWVRDAPINLSNPAAGSLTGRFEKSSIDAIAMQINYRL